MRSFSRPSDVGVKGISWYRASADWRSGKIPAHQVINVPFRELMDTLADVDRARHVFPVTACASLGMTWSGRLLLPCRPKHGVPLESLPQHRLVERPS